jgi:hypothetical protein
MSRTTATFAWVQTLLVILGFFALGIVLKMSGYPDAPAVRWNPLAVALRERGFWLLLAPAVWVVFETYAERIDRGLFSYRTVYLAGLALTVALFVLFLYAICFPYSHPTFLPAH